MKLDPQARVFLERLERANPPCYEDIGVRAARVLYRMRRELEPPPAPVASVSDMRAPGPGGFIALRVYRPLGAKADTQLPALIYFHGGGWVLGDLDTHDGICRELANLAECCVVAVDYRLAPEHKFPAAVDDALAMTRWIAQHAASLHIDAERLAVGGDSAGATLAACVALTWREANPPLLMQVLIYPALDMMGQSASHAELAEGYGLTRKSILWFRNHYLRDEDDALDWRASPLRAPDLRGAASAYVLSAGFDPLRDEAKRYAERLAEAGVTVTYECFEGMIHGFINLGSIMAAAQHAIYRSAQALKAVFHPQARR
jgi:acetyl esterase